MLHYTPHAARSFSTHAGSGPILRLHHANKVVRIVYNLITMLVLSRKKEEVIIINDVIRIKIVDIGNDAIKLGIDAPKNVKIYREEVWKSIQEENISAVQRGGDDVTRINREFMQRGRDASEQESGDGPAQAQAKAKELAGAGASAGADSDAQRA